MNEEGIKGKNKVAKNKTKHKKRQKKLPTLVWIHHVLPGLLAAAEGLIVIPTTNTLSKTGCCRSSGTLYRSSSVCRSGCDTDKQISSRQYEWLTGSLLIKPSLLSLSAL